MVSGQLVNYQKSCIQFFNGVSNADRKVISQIFQILVSDRTSKYLGLMSIEKNKRITEDFDHIRRKLGQKLAGWKVRTLSAVSKIVLIKSNLTGISQYFMNWLKFLKYICKEIDKVSRGFLWNDNCESTNMNRHKLHYLAWDKICRPKCEGGLGI